MKALPLELRIDWSDMDMLGHVNNISISRYMQAARIHYMDLAGLKVFPGMVTGPILASAKVDFLKQLHFPGKVTVFTRCSGIRNTSLTLDHVLADEAGSVRARSQEIIVYFDFAAGKPLRVTDSIREQINVLENSFTEDVPES